MFGEQPDGAGVDHEHAVVFLQGHVVQALAAREIAGIANQCVEAVGHAGDDGVEPADVAVDQRQPGDRAAPGGILGEARGGGAADAAGRPGDGGDAQFGVEGILRLRKINGAADHVAAALARQVGHPQCLPAGRFSRPLPIFRVSRLGADL